jgi:molybdenum cofactor cytidylyltransferase
VIVVLGAGAEAIRPAIESLAIEIAVNPDWETGMGSSIRTGLQRLLERDKSPEYLAILLADQPHVHAAHLAEMHGLLTRSDASLIAAEYEGTLGVPAIFRRDLYPALATLPAQAGARQLLREHEAELLRYPLPAAAIDIDTPSDFAALEPE